MMTPEPRLRSRPTALEAVESSSEGEPKPVTMISTTQGETRRTRLSKAPLMACIAEAVFSASVDGDVVAGGEFCAGACAAAHVGRLRATRMSAAILLGESARFETKFTSCGLSAANPRRPRFRAQFCPR